MALNDPLKLYPVKADETSYRVIDGEAILVNYANSFFYHLNPVATVIWAYCDGQHTLEQIATQLAAVYDVTLEKARQDCRKFTDHLAEHGLVRWIPEPLAPAPGSPTPG